MEGDQVAICCDGRFLELALSKVWLGGYAERVLVSREMEGCWSYGTYQKYVLWADLAMLAAEVAKKAV